MTRDQRGARVVAAAHELSRAQSTPARRAARARLLAAADDFAGVPEIELELAQAVGALDELAGSVIEADGETRAAAEAARGFVRRARSLYMDRDSGRGAA